MCFRMLRFFCLMNTEVSAEEDAYLKLIDKLRIRAIFI